MNAEFTSFNITSTVYGISNTGIVFSKQSKNSFPTYTSNPKETTTQFVASNQVPKCLKAS